MKRRASVTRLDGESRAMPAPRLEVIPGLRAQAKRETEAKPRANQRKRVGQSVSITTLTGLSDAGEPLVRDLRRVRAPSSISARSMCALSAADVGREVVVAFEDGKRSRPVIMGKLHDAQPATEVEVTLDQQRIVLSAEQELTLRCGASSITLTRAGKILIRGAYLCSRASGVNRILGGSVQIN